MDITLTDYDLQKRDIFLYNEINENSAQDIIRQCTEIITSDNNIIKSHINAIKQFYPNIDENILNNKNNIPEVNIYLNSPGGIIYQGLAIYDMFKKLNEHAKTNIITSGTCMSMGVIILLSLPYEQRLCTKNTTFLIHQASGWSLGKVADMEDYTKECKRQNDLLFNIMIENTAITKEQLENIYNKKQDWFFTAEEALKLKLISKII